ncbi:MAG TPA: PAS domain S-box protein [Methanosarcina sp.]
MNTKMDHFPAINPNPVLSIEKDGTIIYSNEASEPLLREWSVKVGEKLPSSIRDLVQKVISSNSSEKMEVKVEKRVYLLAFHPVPEEECLNIYGFDISGQKEIEEKLRESEKRERARSDELAAVLDAVPVAVFISRDPQVLKITGNRLACEWVQLPVGANFSKSASEGESPETFKLFKDGMEMLPEEMPSQMASAGIEVNDCELYIISADGNIRHLLGNARPLRDEQGNLRGSISAFIDITERKKAEEAVKKAFDSLEIKVKERTDELEQAYISLKESKERLAEAQEMAHIGNWDRNLVTNELYWSDEMCHIFRLNPQSGITYNVLLSYLHPDDRDYVDNAVKRAIRGEPFDIDHRIISDGEERIVHAQGKAIFDEKNTPIRIRGIVQDITERKIAEEKIQYLANVVESSTDAIVTVSLDSIVTSWNKGAEQIFGYAAEEILGKKVSILEPENLRGDIKQLVEKVKQGKKIKHYESSRLKKDGTIIIISGTLSPVMDMSGKLVAISVIVRDITDRKRTEDVIKNIEIARKKEIHHRIKNNLQIISSLLDLQAEKFRNRKDIVDTEVMDAFVESQNRVASMALIHEELYKDGNVNTINFSSYVKELTDNLFLSYRLGNTDVSLNMVMEENLFFDMDIAIPLGIIINEIVSNSLKHAFKGRDKGIIQIELLRDENEESKSKEFESTAFVFKVSDNGMGIPEDLDIGELDSLGLQLITTLVNQLDGELDIKNNNGTEFVIRFTLEDNNLSEPATN